MKILNYFQFASQTMRPTDVSKNTEQRIQYIWDTDFRTILAATSTSHFLRTDAGLRTKVWDFVMWWFCQAHQQTAGELVGKPEEKTATLCTSRLLDRFIGDAPIAVCCVCALTTDPKAIYWGTQKLWNAARCPPRATRTQHRSVAPVSRHRIFSYKRKSLLTSKQHSPSWETNIRQDRKEIPSLSWNPKFH